MEQGTIKTLVLSKGFGFIAVANSPDLFFHCKDLDPALPFDETLQERRVQFVIVGSPKGPRAAGVQPA